MSLSSLIVQREVATMRQVEEALARQVLYGGDLVTNLLEVARLDETVLTGLLAESIRLPPAPPGELPLAPDSVLALVPSQLADRHVMIPLGLDGETLIVALAEPLAHDPLNQLIAATGRAVEQRAASAIRVRQAIARAYGLPLEPRLQRLLSRFAAETEGRPARSQTPAFGSLASRAPASTIPVPAVARRRTSTNFLAGGKSLEWAPSAALASPDQVDGAPAPLDGTERLRPVQRETAPSPRISRRRRGPITMESASRLADEAVDRDALLDLFFDFSKQYFDFAALFVVHADIAAGRHAFGTGADERIVGIGVPLDLPSVLSRARDTKLPIVERMNSDGLDGVLASDLQRPSSTETAVVPLVVRTRAVALLVADCGDAGIDGTSVDQVVAFSHVVGRSFERLIVRRKRAGVLAGAKPPEAPGAQEATTFSQQSTAPPPAERNRSFAPAWPSDAPPPRNILAVRNHTGPPIPREEPMDSMGALRRAPPRTLIFRDAPGPMPIRTPSPLPAVILSSSAETASDRSQSSDAMESSPEIDVADFDGEIPADLDSRALFDLLGWETGDDPPDVPPPSSTFAVSAHRPPVPYAPSEELPSVIVDLDEELATMVDRLVAGETDDQAERELLHQGERAMRVLMARFPGPLTFDRARFATMASPPRPSECGPLLRLIARERKVALPFVLERLSDDDPEVRGWATHLVCELPYAEAILPLLPRLSDPDASTRASATHALAAIARLCPEETREAIDTLARGADPAGQAGALGVMALLRDARRVPELVRALAEADPRVAGAAHLALVQLTRQDFGPDARPWLRWWEQNSSRHRVEWLIDALTHDVSEIRSAAGEELRALSREYFGFASDLPPRDRERAQQRYRDWWLADGRGRFSRR
ncbi:MAG: HEAT repeat domain-containing protein [Myxococcota bacterium]|nr:HEAT repeat domain-containing protein [Myxococcota bacterium]